MRSYYQHFGTRLFIQKEYITLEYHLKRLKISYLKDAGCVIPYTSKTELLSLIRSFMEIFGKEMPIRVSKTLHKCHNYYYPITYLYEQLNHEQVVRLIEKRSFVSTLQPIMNIKAHKNDCLIVYL